MKKILYTCAIILLLVFLTDTSYALDIMNLRDQSTLRCPGGIVARGDSDIRVTERCGDPLKIANRQDFGPIWIYHFGQERFMFYLSFLHGNLQRIASARCSPNRAECLDIR
ncbi:MAG: DUF2845 domain-containing protein [Deltaproteobacteria bacterium]|nr:DUF2845 domain-containing protein [Deltaproteobacteria bacterium]